MKNIMKSDIDYASVLGNFYDVALLLGDAIGQKLIDLIDATIPAAGSQKD